MAWPRRTQSMGNHSGLVGNKNVILVAGESPRAGQWGFNSGHLQSERRVLCQELVELDSEKWKNEKMKKFWTEKLKLLSCTQCGSRIRNLNIIFKKPNFSIFVKWRLRNGTVLVAEWSFCAVWARIYSSGCWGDAGGISKGTQPHLGLVDMSDKISNNKLENK